MKIVAATTFNANGYALYGKRMIETFAKHWCCDVKLKVYAEGWKPEVLDPKIEYYDLYSSSDWLDRFKRRNVRRNRPDGFRHDAVRFSHKVAALFAAYETEAVDFLIWLDGDIVTHSKFDSDSLESILPYRHPITWLDRRAMYPECGFYILNCRSTECIRLMRLFKDMYEKDMLFALPEWHDSYVLEYCVKRLHLVAQSLSGNGYNSHHPLVNSPLAHWFDHLKGSKRKLVGRSHKTDLIADRTEQYWARG